MKHFYKFTGLFLLFCGALIYFATNIPQITVATTTEASIQDASFPIMYLQIGDKTINTLHGYSGDMNSGTIRESITPIDTTKTITVKIQQNESKIKKLNYQLRDIANDKVIEEDALTAFDTVDGQRTTNIKLSGALDTSTEYGFQVTLTTSYSKKIHFYTRIKYYTDSCFLKEKLDFVSKFHEATFNKGKNFDIEPYLEANTNDNSSLAKVDIHSGKKMIQWKKLNPKRISAVVPTIKEINIETAAISQDYYVQAKTDSGLETYHVKEFYRLRYSGNRIYLLAFNRTMEAFFDPKLISLTESEFKIGITNQTDLDVASSDSNKKIAFVRNGSLWYYNLKTNKLTSIFSFAKNSKDYLRDNYDQHDIKILKMDNKGNISFMVYGYMNCGDYEGRVGILLYDYDAKENHITERVYLPLSTTYQQLKEDLGDFCYVNDKNIFYFSINDMVYAYNISSKRYDILTKHATRDHFSMLKAAKCFVWSNIDKNGYAKNISILNLDTTKTEVVTSPAGQSIVVLGTIDANIVYGYVRNKDIYESNNGEIVQPAYILTISDCEGNIIRKYKAKNRYITGATISDNVIELKCAKKKNGKFVSAQSDTIMNQKDSQSKSVSLTSRVTQKTLTEKYLTLPAGFVLNSLPSVHSTKHIMVTDNTTVHLSDKELTNTVKYYIYANGEITGSVTSAAKAITMADEQMGTVLDSDSHIVWERGGKFISKQLSNISYPSDTSTSSKACAQMLLQAAQVTTSTSQLSGHSILSMLKKHLANPVNLTGCTVDEILYFVSSGKPVIGMIDTNHAILITEYTSSTVTWMDPVTHHKKKVSLNAAEHTFKNSGYRFVSFIAN